MNATRSHTQIMPYSKQEEWSPSFLDWYLDEIQSLAFFSEGYKMQTQPKNAQRLGGKVKPQYYRFTLFV